MRVSAGEGWVEFLYKTVGQGLSLLAERQPGESVSVLGPIGTGFAPNPERRQLLAIGGGVGIPPMMFLAETLLGGPIDPIVLMGSEVPFPFEEQQSEQTLPGIPRQADGVVPELEALGIPSRLASNAELPHAFPGFVTDLARAYLDSQSEQALRNTQIGELRPHTHVAGSGDIGKGVWSTLPGGAGRVHGLRCGRLCRLHRTSETRRRTRYEASLRRWAGFRRGTGFF